MAEILISREKSNLSSLWKFFSGFLPDDTQIIVGPSLQQHMLDAVVVSPRNISLLFIKDWEGEVQPQKDKPWLEYLKSGSTVYHSGIIGESESAKVAMQVFLKDKFPLIEAAVNSYLVLINPNARFKITEAVTPKPVSPFTLLKALEEDAKAVDGFLSEKKNRDELVNALVEQQAGDTGKLKRPFIFHSKGFIEHSTRVWTIQDAIQYLSFHPEEGAQYLRNGSLAEWFKEAGAEPLAQMALEAGHQQVSDSRILLEDFLLNTGLVQRPKIWFFPRILKLGGMLAGQSKTKRFYILQGFGRGFLYGKIQTADPDLECEPVSFHGRLTAIDATYCPANMVMEKEDRQTELVIESNAETQPRTFIVAATVMPMPSPFRRYILRPLISLLSGITGGLLIGYLLGLLHFAAPFGLSSLLTFLASPALFWVLALGVLWGFVGLWRGLHQHPAWTIGFAAGKWLIRSAVWTLILFIAILPIAWGLNVFHIIDFDFSFAGLFRLALLAGAFSVIPAVIGEIVDAGNGTEGEEKGRGLLHFFKPAEFGPALAALFLIGFSIIGQVFSDTSLVAGNLPGEGFLEGQAASLENKLNHTIDMIVFDYYDRRQPPEEAGLSNVKSDGVISRASTKEMIDQFFSGIWTSVAEFYYKVIEERPMPKPPIEPVI